MQQITSFSITEWQNEGNEHLLDEKTLDKSYKELLKCNPNYDKVSSDLEAAADAILEAADKPDDSHVKQYAEHIYFTANIKASIAMHPEKWIASGKMQHKEYHGMCLDCGKILASSDIVLADTAGESSCVCLECTDELNELGEGFELILIK